MRLNDTLWMQYELDLQEVKLTYLNWAISYAIAPDVSHQHLFLWEHQGEFCLVGSKYGRAFGMSPFGVGVRGGTQVGIDLALKDRLVRNTAKIRSAIGDAFSDRDLKSRLLTYTSSGTLRHPFSYKDKGKMSLAQLQRFLRHDHQKTTEIYAGHIEMGTRKQTDYLADFYQRKLVDSETVAYSAAYNSGKKRGVKR